MTVPIPLLLAPVMEEISQGMDLKKCRKCGCMKDALDGAERAFTASDEDDVQALVPIIAEFQGRFEEVKYDCIGCKKCWGADATKQLSVQFGEIEPDACGGGACGGGLKPDAPVVRSARVRKGAWPPYAGDYIIGNTGGSVAVCTLSSRDLSASVVALGEPSVAISGRCDTENIGVEKVVLNILGNPRIRALIVCGTEAEGHRTGDAFLHLQSDGVDANMRVLESASWRPILKNLTLVDVARFREQVTVVNLIGVTSPETIGAAAREFAAHPLAPMAAYDEGKALTFERIKAKPPEKLKLDPAGFFIVLPQSDGQILCEHYHNNGALLNIVEGRRADLIAATVVERGLITRLDHAVYLGRELAKAELSLKTGALYEQDAALGNLPPPPAAESVPAAAAASPALPSDCPDTATCACH